MENFVGRVNKKRLSTEKKEGVRGSSGFKYLSEIGTPKHRQTKSLMGGVPLARVPSSMKNKGTGLGSKVFESEGLTKKGRQDFSVNQPFPMNTRSLRLIKIQKNNGIEEKVRWKSSNLPVSPEKVLKNFREHLTPFEEIEILTVEEVWFIGIGAHKVKTGVKNNGFDEDNGDYRVIAKDHLMYRYEISVILGSGSFGTVVKVMDHKLNKEFAVKIVRNRPKFAESAEDEIGILEFLNAKDVDGSFGVVKLIEKFYFRNHICLKFELLGLSLYQYMKMNNYKGFSLDIIKKIAKQLLTTLSILEDHNIIHCDLKPENILFQSSSTLEVKLVDFGSSTFAAKRFFSYIQSRYYRAPEIILGLDYSTKIDLWSLGCILCELFTGKPIFAGESETEQFQCIMDYLGPPPPTLSLKSPRKSLFFLDSLEPKQHPNSKNRPHAPNSKSLKDLLKPSSDPHFTNLIHQLLSWDPISRLSPKSALDHPWFRTPAQNHLTKPLPKHSKTQSQASFNLFNLLSHYPSSINPLHKLNEKQTNHFASNGKLGKSWVCR